MTSQTTTTRPNTKGVRVHLGATAVTLIVFGSTLLWSLRPSGGAAPRAIDMPVVTTTDGITPAGGLAEQHREVQRAGMGNEPPLDITALTDGSGHFLTEQQVSTAQMTTNGMAEGDRELGGMAELYREQAQRTSSAP